MSDPRASILVCTRNRADLLGRNLETILADRSAVPRELVVVDNGSTDATPAVVRSVAARAPWPVRYVREPRTGLTPARNAAVRAARGELLLFTDDDLAVRDGWADALAAGFDGPEVVMVGGRIEAEWPVPPPAWLNGPHATMLTNIDLGSTPRLLGPREHPPGANFAVRAEALRGIDPPFHPRLGHSGKTRVGHEEMYLANRLREVGTVAYRPDALVVLWIDGRRLDLDWMRSSFFQLGIGLGRCIRLERRPFPSAPRRAVRALRLVRSARRLTRTNDVGSRLGPETWEELYTYMWAGLHVEMLLGRSNRLSDWTVRAVG